MASISMDRLSPADRKYLTKEIRRIQGALKTARTEAGVTQEKMAEDLDISVEHIRMIENSRGIPSLQMLLLMARYLDLKLELQ